LRSEGAPTRSLPPTPHGGGGVGGGGGGRIVGFGGGGDGVRGRGGGRGGGAPLGAVARAAGGGAGGARAGVRARGGGQQDQAGARHPRRLRRGPPLLRRELRPGAHRQGAPGWLGLPTSPNNKMLPLVSSLCELPVRTLNQSQQLVN
jgi:hypothetical protein